MIKIVSSTEGDWIAVYINDLIWKEGHSLNNMDIARLLRHLGHEVVEIEYDENWQGWGGTVYGEED